MFSPQLTEFVTYISAVVAAVPALASSEPDTTTLVPVPIELVLVGVAYQRVVPEAVVTLSVVELPLHTVKLAVGVLLAGGVP